MSASKAADAFDMAFMQDFFPPKIVRFFYTRPGLNTACRSIQLNLWWNYLQA